MWPSSPAPPQADGQAYQASILVSSSFLPQRASGFLPYAGVVSRADGRTPEPHDPVAVVLRFSCGVPARRVRAGVAEAARVGARLVPHGLRRLVLLGAEVLLLAQVPAVLVRAAPDVPGGVVVAARVVEPAPGGRGPAQKERELHNAAHHRICTRAVLYNAWIKRALQTSIKRM